MTPHATTALRSARALLCLILTATASGLVAVPSYAQQATDAVTDSIAYFFAYHKQTAQEKLYLTTDRPYYEAGDTLWFRGTLVNADSHSMLVKTNYITVELLNKAGGLVMRRKVQRLSGELCFEHCLPLPSELATGEYTLRGFTSWQQNFNPDLLFSRKLTVVGRETPTEAGVPRLAPDFGIAFFPEGGALLAGAEGQRVAFKAEANDRLPQPVAGIIRDSAGHEIVRFASLHDGMGAFYLPAEALTPGVRLTAEVQALTEDGGTTARTDTMGVPLTHSAQLPPVSDEGFALALTAQDDSTLTYRILAAGPAPYDAPLHLVLHSGSRVVAYHRVKTSDSGTLPTVGLRDGVSQLLLLSPEGRTLSRRLVFCRHANRMTAAPRVTPTWRRDDPRGYVKMDVRLADAEGHPLRGDFAVSVTDAAYVNHTATDGRDHIETNLLLTSDLPGYIHRPAWYLDLDADAPSSPTAEEQRQGLDLLMLTHGWTRFDVAEPARHPDRDFAFPLEEREYVTGRVLHLKKELKHTSVSVVDTVSNTFGSARLDDEDRFFVSGLSFADGALLHLRMLGRKNINPEYVFDDYTFPAPAHREPFRTDFAQYIAQAAQDELYVGRDGMRTILLHDVEVVDDRRSQSPLFKSIITERRHNADYLAKNYDLYEYDNALSLVNQIIENEWSLYVSPPVELFGDDVPLFDELPGTASPGDSSSSKWGPLGTFVVDGTTYDNVPAALGILERIRSVDVDRIEIIDQQNNLLAPFSGKSALVVLLKPGAVIRSAPKDGRYASFRAFGYTPATYFYNPLYDTPEHRAEHLLPDLRKTLRWDASIQSDAEGLLQFDFYNSDHTGPRHLLIEGVTFDGRPVHIETDF